MKYRIKGLRTYRVGGWIKGQFYLQGVLITFGYNLYTHHIWYEGIIDGQKCDPWYLHNKYGLDRYDLEDSIEEYAITWFAKMQKKDQVISL